MGYSAWGRKESDMTGRFHFTSLTSLHTLSLEKEWQPTPVFFPGESHGQRSLEGHGPWGRRESDMTEVTELTS